MTETTVFDQEAELQFNPSSYRGGIAAPTLWTHLACPPLVWNRVRVLHTNFTRALCPGLLVDTYGFARASCPQTHVFCDRFCVCICPHHRVYYVQYHSWKHKGAFSGEQFREDLLVGKYAAAKEKREKLVIDLDGGYGYPTVFLEEAFGGLARMYGSKEVLDTLTFVSNDEPSLIGEIESYIRSAGKKR